MKKNKIFNLILVAIGLIAFATSCGKEDPFPINGKIGKLSTYKMMLSLDNESDEKNKETPSTRGVDVADFTVDIIDSEGNIAYSSLYADMPSVVELPVGKYIAKAHLGTPQKAAFEAPYFEGSSEEFTIVEDEITDLQTIVCKFANVKVTIRYSEGLKKAMADDAHVNVLVADNASLDFFRDETRSGYFAYLEGSSTLVATFKGKVNNVEETSSKVFTEVAPGVHYRITYTLHNPGEDPNASGNIIPGLTVDASVDIVEYDYNIEDDPEVIPDPEDPEDPNDPKGDEGPVLTMDAPLSFDQVNQVTPSSNVVVKVTSTTGITAFVVDIESSTLTEAVLSDVGLSAHLDLVNPGAFEDKIAGLGLPVNVGGKKEVIFDISSFMPLLAIYGSNAHNFVMTVSDSSGTTKKTLKLQMNP